MKLPNSLYKCTFDKSICIFFGVLNFWSKEVGIFTIKKPKNGDFQIKNPKKAKSIPTSIGINNYCGESKKSIKTLFREEKSPLLLEPKMSRYPPLFPKPALLIHLQECCFLRQQWRIESLNWH